MLNPILDCEAVDPEGAAAFDVGTRRLVLVWGTRPSTCHYGRVEPVKAPDTYRSYLCQRPGVFCLMVLSPYVAYLEVGANAATSVTVLGAKSAQKVPVTKVNAVADIAALLPKEFRAAWKPPTLAAPAVPPAPAPVPPLAPTAHEGFGVSTKFSFDEAFQNAIRDAAPKQLPHPDALTSVVVTEIGARLGGIANFHELFVRVKLSVM